MEEAWQMDIIKDQGNRRLVKFRHSRSQIICRNKCVLIEDHILRLNESILADHHNRNMPKSPRHNDTMLALVLQMDPP
jgi:hypothetical protein